MVSRFLIAGGMAPLQRDAGNNNHESRNPHHSWPPVAIVRPGEYAAQQGVAKQRQRYGPRQQRNIVEFAAPCHADEHAGQQRHGKQRDRHMNPVDGRDVEFPLLLASISNRGQFRGR